MVDPIEYEYCSQLHLKIVPDNINAYLCYRILPLKLCTNVVRSRWSNCENGWRQWKKRLGSLIEGSQCMRRAIERGSVRFYTRVSKIFDCSSTDFRILWRPQMGTMDRSSNFVNLLATRISICSQFMEITFQMQGL